MCCNGAVTIALDPGRVPGYDLLEAVTFDPTPALDLLKGSWPDAVVAVEELGVGFKVSAPFPDGELEERWSWCPGKSSPPDRSPA